MKKRDEYATNVAYIEISEDTKKLITCRAQLHDIGKNVADVIRERYGEAIQGGTIDDIWDKVIDLDNKLTDIIGFIINVTTTESNFTKM